MLGSKVPERLLMDPGEIVLSVMRHSRADGRQITTKAERKQIAYLNIQC